MFPFNLEEPHPPRPLPCPSWRITVTADGLYRITFETLAAARVPTSDLSSLHLFWRGQEVAMEEDRTGNALVFYGQKFYGTVQDEKYTDENVYWLVVSPTAGLRMESRSVTPGTPATPITWYTATRRFEQNNIYWARWSTMPRTDDTWFWDYIVANRPVTRTYSLTLTALAQGAYTATLRVELAGRSENFHRISFALNGTPVGETTEWGKVGWVGKFPFPSTLLRDGTNLLVMEVFTDGGPQGVYLNWIEVEYRRQLEAEDGSLRMALPLSGPVAITITGFSTSAIRLYDITNPLRPIRLEGATAIPSGSSWALTFTDNTLSRTTYLALAKTVVRDVPALIPYCPPRDILSPPDGADEIIIAPSAFITAIHPLAEHRRAQGLRVRVVAVEDLYNLFNDGIFHPEAIRSFVAHAYRNWPGRPPSMLLLIGDGHFNFKGYNPTTYGEPTPVWIPPYLEFADPWQGEVPVDSRYGDVDGDGFPELAVGRIPAGSVEEVKGAVAKILAYEVQPEASWQTRMLFVADNVPDQAGDFRAVAQHLAGMVPTGAETRTIYLNDYCEEPVNPPRSCPSATLALTTTWSEGASLLTYVGHAAVNRWAHEPLIFNTQLSTLTGTTGLPFLISLDCWDGYWMFPPKYPGFPDTRSIGEWATTVLTNRGAIAVFGPAGLGGVDDEALIAQAMFKAMFQEGNFQLGPLTQAGRRASRTHLARTYVLLGDPALWLPWWKEMTVVPSAVTVTGGSTHSLAALFTVSATTRFGQVFPVTPAWTVGAGILDGWGIYTAPNFSGAVPVTAHLGSLSAEAIIHIVSKEHRLYLPLVMRNY
ncbi:MAG: C25 family cysteine peptidase [Anaerolineae bacterium]|nr:C25 family cysteine peptidase [Anaerolineae bacterium]